MNQLLSLVIYHVFSTQPAWKKEEEAPRKPAAGTQGAWDTTDTPGGLSSETKKVWNLDAIAALVRKELTENLEFYNKPLPKQQQYQVLLSQHGKMAVKSINQKNLHLLRESGREAIRFLHLLSRHGR